LGQTNIFPYISFLWDRQTSPPIYLSFGTDKHLPLYIFPLGQTNISPYISFLWDRQTSPPIYLSFGTDKHLPLYIGEIFVCPKGKIYRGRCLSVSKERYIGGDVCLSQRKDI
jgi:hypothetical protein